MRRFGLIALAVWIVQQGEAPAAPAVELKAARYGDIGKAIRGHRGKVVVVDIWADFCAPCKQAFPHLVEMHHKYGKEGLVCVSVTVDPDLTAGALKFLKGKK